ncbi:uncharacterized protein LOC134224888 [Armigeres subalbatus]|uniref:uncharacterized protein LOC134224888 n=1 Tax=Armigeres subalbatus TaxID=124917 RepID=UPI002ED2F8CA
MNKNHKVSLWTNMSLMVFIQRKQSTSLLFSATRLTTIFLQHSVNLQIINTILPVARFGQTFGSGCRFDGCDNGTWMEASNKKLLARCFLSNEAERQLTWFVQHQHTLCPVNTAPHASRYHRQGLNFSTRTCIPRTIVELPIQSDWAIGHFGFSAHSGGKYLVVVRLQLPLRKRNEFFVKLKLDMGRSIDIFQEEKWVITDSNGEDCSRYDCISKSISDLKAGLQF